MKEFKVVWVKHYGWPEIIVHDQGRRLDDADRLTELLAKWKNRKSGTVIQIPTVGPGRRVSH